MCRKLLEMWLQENKKTIQWPSGLSEGPAEETNTSCNVMAFQ